MSRWGSTSTSTSTDPEGAEVDLEALPERLTPLLPPGIDVEAVVVIDRSETSLQEAVTSCTWVIEVPGPSPEALTAAVDTILAATELPVIRERKGKKVADDLRPGILGLSVVGATPPDAPEPGAVLEAQLATQPRSVRPAELLAAFDPPLDRGPGPQDQPMDHLRRRDARAPLAERAVPGARHGRRPMRREPLHDRPHGQRPPGHARRVAPSHAGHLGLDPVDARSADASHPSVTGSGRG